MKDLVLKKGGIGFLVVLLVSLAASVYYTGKAKIVVSNILPVFQQEVRDFLPITIENGEIVAPKDTVISKDYDNGNGKVVLDTRADEFEPSALKVTGIYISKKYIYSYNNQKIEIRSLKDFPNIVIDEDMVATGVEYADKHAGKFIFFTLLLGSIIGISVVVLISTILMHWLMAILFKVGFSYTLRVNTLTYCVLFLLNTFASVSFSFLIEFMIMVAANVAINTADKKTA